MAPSSSASKAGPVPVESIRVEDKIYSAKKLANMHPGGPLFIKVTTTCRPLTHICITYLVYCRSLARARAHSRSYMSMHADPS